MIINYKKALLNMIDSFMFNNGLNDTICWLYMDAILEFNMDRTQKGK